MRVFLLIIFFIAIVFIYIPNLIKKKDWNELIVFFILTIIGFTLCLLVVIEVRVPNPNDAVKSLVKFFTG